MRLGYRVRGWWSLNRVFKFLVLGLCLFMLKSKNIYIFGFKCSGKKEKKK